MKKPIYLDYAATTPVDPRVAAVMAECLTVSGRFGNPASRSHIYGWQAEEIVEDARASVAELIHADPREIVWTSGATESNNLAIKGLVAARKDKGKHIVTALTEHKSVLDTCEYLSGQGFDVTYIRPDSSGVVRAEQISEVLRDDTILVSIMHVNNEIGVINEIQQIGKLCRDDGVAFHVDAAQSLGKTPVDVKALNVDLLSMSAGKMYGPKGIGALYVRRGPDLKIEAQIHGGGHERGMRSGTLPTHQIAGFGEAAKIAAAEYGQEQKRLLMYRQQFLAEIESIEAVYLNGHPEQRVAGIANISVGYVDGETLLMSLKALALSTGSACTSVSVEPSYVLTAIGVSRTLAHSSLRICFGRFTTEEEVTFAAQCLRDALEKLRQISPAWKNHQAEKRQKQLT